MFKRVIIPIFCFGLLFNVCRCNAADPEKKSSSSEGRARDKRGRDGSQRPDHTDDRPSSPCCI